MASTDPSVTESAEPRETAGSGLRIAKLGAAALAIGFLVRFLANVDWPSVGRALGDAGFASLLVLLPFAAGLVIETVAWQALFRRLDCAVPFLRLLHARFATETLTLVMPGGGAVAEAAGPVLLSPDVPFHTSAATGLGKRWGIVRAHGVFVILSAVCSVRAAHVAGSSGVAVVLGTGVALLALSFVIERGAPRLAARQLGPAVARLAKLRLFAAHRATIERVAIAELPRDLATLSSSRSLPIFAALLAQWLLESTSSFVALRVLGVDIAFFDAIAIDAVLTVIRSAAIFAPAGIGVQDLGYLAFFDAYGLPNAGVIGPAFLVLRRARELVFVAVGVVLLLIPVGKTERTK